MVSATVMDTTRRAWSSLVLLGDIMGFVIPAWFNMMISATLMFVNTLRSVAVAESMTGIGMLHAAFAFTASTLMFSQAMALVVARDQSVDKINSTIALLNIWS